MDNVEISFDEFVSKFEHDEDSTLREIAEEEGLKPPKSAPREVLLELLYAKFQGKELEPIAPKPKSKSGKAGYGVYLREKNPRWRGGRKWAVGMTRVSHDEMHANKKALMKELDRDKSFKYVKLV